MTKRSYFDKQNSTLGSVVPLAMFGTSDDLLDDWVITYELSIYPSHLMTPS